jgi:hypothetical protein
MPIREIAVEEIARNGGRLAEKPVRGQRPVLRDGIVKHYIRTDIAV